MPRSVPDLPTGAIFNCEVLVTSYFDRHGKLKYVVNTGGDVNIAQMMGMLMLGGISLWESYIENIDDEEEDSDDDEPE